MDDDSGNDAAPRKRDTFVGAFVVFASCGIGMSECEAVVSERDEFV